MSYCITHHLPANRLRFWLPLSAAVLILSQSGCQNDPYEHARIPLPNLDPPVIVASTKANPPPARTDASRLTQPQPSSSLPAGWMPPVPAHGWKYIIIHHSATPRNSAAAFDRAHRRRGWNELGYHFVIGNGTNSADGRVEVGPRWIKQKRGAHAGIDRYNEYGIGICLVGDFDIDRPTAKQVESLVKLVAFLTHEYRIPFSRLLGHRDIKATQCPGRYLDVGDIRSRAAAVQLDRHEYRQGGR